ncbi:hypothetical protein BHG40_05070 [Aeromonas salmonicida subsp. masoucida]|nr:hypothetical protein BHG40_05070 [Aeromonas salmonicida subsp. masoucida]
MLEHMHQIIAIDFIFSMSGIKITFYDIESQCLRTISLRAWLNSRHIRKTNISEFFQKIPFRTTDFYYFIIYTKMLFDSINHPIIFSNANIIEMRNI